MEGFVILLREIPLPTSRTPHRYIAIDNCANLLFTPRTTGNAATPTLVVWPVISPTCRRMLYGWLQDHSENRDEDRIGRTWSVSVLLR